ncbi:MAG: UDP-glucose 4-epimerase GalE, partial [Candidatus Omnitrophica bacterium]|nr:UDP-glucose 4-epimerase GalE [Candidatus Omnitrophota bacterium]
MRQDRSESRLTGETFNAPQRSEMSASVEEIVSGMVHRIGEHADGDRKYNGVLGALTQILKGVRSGQDGDAMSVAAHLGKLPVNVDSPKGKSFVANAIAEARVQLWVLKSSEASLDQLDQLATQDGIAPETQTAALNGLDEIRAAQDGSEISNLAGQRLIHAISIRCGPDDLNREVVMRFTNDRPGVLEFIESATEGSDESATQALEILDVATRSETRYLVQEIAPKHPGFLEQVQQLIHNQTELAQMLREEPSQDIRQQGSDAVQEWRRERAFLMLSMLSVEMFGAMTRGESKTFGVQYGAVYRIILDSFPSDYFDGDRKIFMPDFIRKAAEARSEIRQATEPVTVGIPVADTIFKEVPEARMAQIEATFPELVTRRGELVFATPQQMDQFLRENQDLLETAEFKIGGSLSTARVLAALGEEIQFRGYAGQDDPESVLIAQTIRGAGIPESGLKRIGLLTSRTLVFNGRSFVHYIGANRMLERFDFMSLVPEFKRQTKPVLHIGYEALASDEYFKTLGGKLAALKKAVPNLIIVMDTVSDFTGMWQRFPAAGKRILQQVDVFCPNLKEAKAIVNGITKGNWQDPKAIADWFLRTMRRGTIIIKNGANGSYFASNDWLENGQTKVPFRHMPVLQKTVVNKYAARDTESRKRPKIIRDEVGNGDAFVAGIIYGLSHDLSLPQAVAFGTVLGGLSYGQVGGGAIGHDRDTVLRLYKNFARSQGIVTAARSEMRTTEIKDVRIIDVRTLASATNVDTHLAGRTLIAKKAGTDFYDVAELDAQAVAAALEIQVPDSAKAELVYWKTQSEEFKFWGWEREPLFLLISFQKEGSETQYLLGVDPSLFHTEVLTAEAVPAGLNSLQRLFEDFSVSRDVNARRPVREGTSVTWTTSLGTVTGIEGMVEQGQTLTLKIARSEMRDWSTQDWVSQLQQSQPPPVAKPGTESLLNNPVFWIGVTIAGFLLLRFAKRFAEFASNAALVVLLLGVIFFGGYWFPEGKSISDLPELWQSKPKVQTQQPQWQIPFFAPKPEPEPTFIEKIFGKEKPKKERPVLDFLDQLFSGQSKEQTAQQRSEVRQATSEELLSQLNDMEEGTLETWESIPMEPFGAGKTALVTGGLGYIGSFTIRMLRKAGYRVIIYDDLSKGNLEALPDDDGVTFVQGKLSDQKHLARTMREFGVDRVVHFAAFIEAGESVEDPAKYYLNNVVNTSVLLEAMKAANVRKILFSSSAAVYGDPEQVPIHENDRKKPTSPYGWSKWFMEQLLQEYVAKEGFTAIALRYFNAAGDLDQLGESHVPETHIIPIFVKRMLNDQDVTIYGNDYPTADGTNERDYIHVVDLASAHALAVRKLDDTGDQPFVALNVASGQKYSNKQLTARLQEAVEAYTGRPYQGRIQYDPRRPGDPAVLQASAEKANEFLGWQAQFSDLDTILRSAVVWHATHPQGYQRPLGAARDLGKRLKQSVSRGVGMLARFAVGYHYQTLLRTNQAIETLRRNPLLSGTFKRDLLRQFIADERTKFEIYAKKLGEAQTQLAAHPEQAGKWQPIIDEYAAKLQPSLAQNWAVDNLEETAGSLVRSETRGITTYEKQGFTVYRLTSETGATIDVVPAFGHKIISYKVPVNGELKEMLYQPDDITQSGGIFVMFPWANRIANGKFTWDGIEHDVNGIEGLKKDANGHPLHGGARNLAWEQIETSTDDAGLSISAVFDTNRFPNMKKEFGSAQLQITYRLVGNQLRLEHKITGKGPFTFGYHPWWNTATGEGHDRVNVRMPAARRYLVDQLIPYAQRPEPVDGDALFDFRQSREIGNNRYDVVLTELEADRDGYTTSWLDDPAQNYAIVMRGSQTFNHTVLYTPDAPYLCLEHQTSATNAFNLWNQGIDEATPIIPEDGQSVEGVVTYDVVPHDALAEFVQDVTSRSEVRPNMMSLYGDMISATMVAGMSLGLAALAFQVDMQRTALKAWDDANRDMAADRVQRTIDLLGPQFSGLQGFLNGVIRDLRNGRLPDALIMEWNVMRAMHARTMGYVRPIILTENGNVEIPAPADFARGVRWLQDAYRFMKRLPEARTGQRSEMRRGTGDEKLVIQDLPGVGQRVKIIYGDYSTDAWLNAKDVASALNRIGAAFQLREEDTVLGFDLAGSERVIVDLNRLDSEDQRNFNLAMVYLLGPETRSLIEKGAKGEITLVVLSPALTGIRQISESELHPANVAGRLNTLGGIPANANTVLPSNIVIEIPNRNVLIDVSKLGGANYDYQEVRKLEAAIHAVRNRSEVRVDFSGVDIQPWQLESFRTSPMMAEANRLELDGERFEFPTPTGKLAPRFGYKDEFDGVLSQRAQDNTAAIQSWSQGQKGKGRKVMLHFGIGGQGMSNSVQIDFWGEEKDNLVIVVDRLGTSMKELFDHLIHERGYKASEIVLDTSSKSGTTDETLIFYQTAFVELLKRLGEEQGLAAEAQAAAQKFEAYFKNFNQGKDKDALFKDIPQEEFRRVFGEVGIQLLTELFDHLVFTTSLNPRDSRLHAMVLGLTDLLGSVAEFDFSEYTGGRFTEHAESAHTTNVWRGLDVPSMLRNLRSDASMYQGVAGNDPERNSALKAAMLTHLIEPSFMVVAVRSPNALSEALQKVQLFPESNGKDGQGVFVVATVGQEELNRKVAKIVRETGKAPLVVVADYQEGMYEGVQPMRLDAGLASEVPVIRYVKEDISPEANARFALWFHEFAIRYGLISEGMLARELGIQLEIPRVGASEMNKPVLQSKPNFFGLRDPQNQPFVELAKKALVEELTRWSKGDGKTESATRARYHEMETRVAEGRYLDRFSLGDGDHQLSADESEAVLSRHRTAVDQAAESQTLEAQEQPIHNQELIQTLKEIQAIKTQIKAKSAELLDAHNLSVNPLTRAAAHHKLAAVQAEIEALHAKVRGLYAKVRRFGREQAEDPKIEEAARQLAVLKLAARDHKRPGEGRITSPVFYTHRPEADLLGEFIEAIDYGIGTRDQHANFQHRIDGKYVTATLLVDFVTPFDKVRRMQDPMATYGLAKDYLDGVYPDEVRRVFLEQEYRALTGELGINFINHEGQVVDKRTYRDAAILRLPDISTEAGLLTAFRIFSRAEALYQQALAQRSELRGQAAFDAMVKIGHEWVNHTIPAEGITMEDGTVVTRITNPAQLPDAVRPYWKDHVALVVLRNADLGYQAYIGLHHLLPFTNTLAQPEPVEELSGAIGGIRNLIWNSEEQAMIDALTLSYAMTVKIAWVGFDVLPLGGSKTMIHFDPNAPDERREEVYKSVGRVLEKLPLTTVGQDVNTSMRYLKVTGAVAPSRTVGSEDLPLGGDDASPHTARGVQAGIREIVKVVEGDAATLKGRLISVQGAGDVGSNLIRDLIEEDHVRIVVSDTNPEKLNDLRQSYAGRIHEVEDVSTFDFAAIPEGHIAILSDSDSIYDVPAEIFSPNALKGVLNEQTIPRLAKAGVKIVAGASNDQLATAEDAGRLHAAGIKYGVDYVINGGGVSGIFTRVFGVNMTNVVRTIGESTGRLVRESEEGGEMPAAIAEREAFKRLYEYDEQMLPHAMRILGQRLGGQVAGIQLASEMARTGEFSEEGYESIAATGDVRAMQIYIRRYAAFLGLTFINGNSNDGIFRSFAASYTARVRGVANPVQGDGIKTLEEMKEALLKAASEDVWIKAERSEMRLLQDVMIAIAVGVAAAGVVALLWYGADRVIRKSIRAIRLNAIERSLREKSYSATLKDLQYLTQQIVSLPPFTAEGRLDSRYRRLANLFAVVGASLARRSANNMEDVLVELNRVITFTQDMERRREDPRFQGAEAVLSELGVRGLLHKIVRVASEWLDSSIQSSGIWDRYVLKQQTDVRDVPRPQAVSVPQQRKFEDAQNAYDRSREITNEIGFQLFLRGISLDQLTVILAHVPILTREVKLLRDTDEGRSDSEVTEETWLFKCPDPAVLGRILLSGVYPDATSPVMRSETRTVLNLREGKSLKIDGGIVVRATKIDVDAADGEKNQALLTITAPKKIIPQIYGDAERKTEVLPSEKGDAIITWKELPFASDDVVRLQFVETRVGAATKSGDEGAKAKKKDRVRRVDLSVFNFTAATADSPAMVYVAAEDYDRGIAVVHGEPMTLSQGQPMSPEDLLGRFDHKGADQPAKARSETRREDEFAEKLLSTLEGKKTFLETMMRTVSDLGKLITVQTELLRVVQTLNQYLDGTTESEVSVWYAVLSYLQRMIDDMKETSANQSAVYWQLWSTVSEVEKLAAEAEKRIETARQAMTRQDATAPVITRSESKTEVDIDAMIERASELKRDNGAYRQPLADVQDLLAKNKIPEAAGLARELLRDDADMIFGDVEEFLKSVQALRSETRPASTETLSVPISNFPEFVRQWRDTYAPGIQAVNGYTFEPHVADTMVALTRKELQGESFLAITRETSGLRFLNFNRVRGNRALNQPNYIRDVNITIVGRYIYISAQSWLEYGQNRVDTREKRGIRFPIEKDRVSLRFDPSTGSLQLVLPADAQAKLDRYVTEFSAEEALHHSEPWKQVALNHVQLISSAETAELVEQRSETRQKVTPQPIPVQVGQGLVIASESGKFVHRISVNSTHPDRGEVEVWRVGAVSGTTIRKGESEEVSAGIFVTPSAIHSREVDFDVEGPEGTVVFTSKQYEWIEMMSSSDRQAELQNVIHALEDVLARAQRTKQDTVVPAAKDHLEKLRSKWVSISDVDRARNYFTEQWWNGIPDVDRQGERPMARLPFSSLLNSGDDVVFRCGSVDRFELLRDGSIRYSERDKADWQAFKAPRVLNLDLRADERLLNSDSAGPMKEIAELIRTNPDAEVLILKEGGQHFKYEGSGLALVLPSGRAFWAFQDLGSKVTALDSKPELTGSIRSFPSDRHMRSVIEQYMTDHGVLGQRSEARNNLTTEQGKTVMVKTPNAVYEIYVREVAGEMVSIEKPIDGSKVGRRVERYGIGDAVELEGSIRIIVEAIRGNEREVDLRVADGVDAELYSQKAYARLQVEAAETRSEVRNIITPVRIETPIAMLRDRTQAEILLKALIPETGTPLRILESWNDLQGSGNILPAQAQRIGNAIWVRMSPNDRLIPLVLEDSDTLLIGGVEGNEPILVHQVPLRDRQWMFRVSAAELLGMEYAVHVERSPIELVGADAIEDSMPAGRVRAQSWEEYLMQPDHLIYSEKVVKQVLNAAGVAEAPSPFILQDMFWPRILRVQSKTGDRSPSLALLIFLPGKETEGQTDDYPGRLIVIPLQQREKLYREQYEDFLQLQEAILREYDTDGQATPVGSIVPEVVRLPAQYASVFDAENAVLRIFRSESRAESLTELLEKFKTLRIESLNTRDEKILREQALNVPVLRFRIKEQLDQEVWAQIQYQLNLLLTVQRQPLARLARFMMEEVASLRDIGPLMTDQEANSERIAELTRSVETNRGEIQTAIEAMNPQIGDEKEAIGQLLEQAGLMPEQHAALLWAVLDDMKGIQDTERMAAVAVLTDQYQRSETRRDSFGMPGSGGTGAIDTRYILDLLTRLRTKPAEAMQELTAIATALEALETRLAEIKDDKNYADTDAFKREISDPFKALAQRWRELALVMTSFSMLPKAFRVLSDLHLQDKLDGAVLEGNQMKVESAQELAQSIRQQYESGELGRMQETLAELESQFERLRVRMLYFNTDVTIVSRYVIDRWTAAGLRRIHEEEAASRRQRYGYLETGYQRPSEERSEMRRKKQAEPISSELEERVQRLMAVPQKVEEFEPHSLLERVFAVDSRKLREMILLERQLKDFRTLLEKNPQTVKAPTPYMAEITGPDNKTALQIVTIALERLSERIAWHYETQLANFIRHRWGHIQQTARGNEGDVMVGNRYYQMMISEERDSVYVELGRNFRESGKSYPIEAEIRNAGFSMAITDPETVKLIKSAVATRISAWNRDVQEDLFKGMMERRMRTQRSETRAEDQLVLSLPADKFMEVVSQQSGVVEPFMKSEKPTMEELLQRETPQFVIFEVMDAGEDVNREVRSIDLIFTMSALNEHGIQPSEHGGDARQLLLYSRDRVNLAWATPESRVKVWRKLRDHKTQLQLNDEQLQQVAQVLDIAAIVANVEEEIKWLATHQQIEEAIRVFTLNRHTFDPEALGRLTEVLEANYQGPIAIVGKVGGSTWAFEAGTPWGLLGYRISGRTNEKEDGTPLANEQEFTDRLTGALGQMVERYGVNRVMHAYFSAPGSFRVNDVLLEDEPNIPTVKKGYSFM